jgi:type I restriction enzyme, S subunit
MSSNWPKMPLASLVQEDSPITYGVVKPGDEDPLGVKFIRGGDIAEGRILTDQLRTISTTISAQYSRTLLRGGELIVSLVGNPGQVAIVPPELAGANLARQVGLVRLHDGNDAGFIKYSLLSESGRFSLGAQSLGSVQQVINLRDLKTVEIALPPLAEQRAIAGVLGALDDKIESNRRTSRTLEKLARAIFRAWFVDFEPVKAKAAGVRSFPSMPQEAFDALPTRFVDSELGPIPEGWEVKAVSQAFDVNPTRTLRKSECVPYLEMKGMPSSGHAPETWVDRPFGSGMRFMNGDTLVARITPCLENGKTAFIDFLSDGQVAWGSTEYIVLRPKPPAPPIFAYCLARTDEFRDFAIQNMTGTSGRQRVAPTAMDHFHIALPSEHVVVPFGETVQPMFNRIRAIMNESRTLAGLREYLLPKLLSGEVRVADPERMVGSAV